MAVLIEAISLIIRLEAIDAHFPGGRQAFEQTIPNSTACGDGTFIRVGFMTPADVGAYVSVLEASGLTFQRDGQTIDMAVVDQRRGPTVPSPWLEVGNISTKDMQVTACWAQGVTPGGIGLPRGWKFEGSLSQTSGFAAEGSDGDHLQFLRRDNDTDVYLNLLTGKEVYVGRPSVAGDTAPALFTRLEKISHEALDLDGQSQPLKAMGDSAAAAPLFQRLTELLQETQRIATGPGVELAFAHFTNGLLLRILKRLPEAEAAFRLANQLKPGVINTLRELVRCLGEQGKHSEALPFAREASEVGPVDSGAWGNLAMCLIQCGERDEARKAIDFAIDLDPTDPINRTIRDNFDQHFQ